MSDLKTVTLEYTNRIEVYNLEEETLTITPTKESFVLSKDCVKRIIGKFEGILDKKDII